MLLSSALTVLSLLAAVAPTSASTSLHRRRCRANQVPGGGSINVGDDPNKPTSSPDDAPEPTKSTDDSPPVKTNTPKPSGGCFPSPGFNVPDSPNGIDVGDWWCSRDSEYAFLGFSYAVDGCPSKSAMTSDFKQMKGDYNARYARLYGACDRNNFHSDVVDAAYTAGIGIFALVWFGFDGGSQWKSRLADIEDALASNPRAPYVIRNVAIGSEPLFDHAISAGSLVDQINELRNKVKGKGVQVATSEMSYLLVQNTNVLDTVDNAQLNCLPFFASDATFGSNARDRVTSDINSIANATDKKKKIFLTQTGWPSNENVWKANAASAVASVASEKAYFDLLDDMCPTFKTGPAGGVGWFAHIWADEGLPGWGITNNGKAKFDFNARTKC